MQRDEITLSVTVRVIIVDELGWRLMRPPLQRRSASGDRGQGRRVVEHESKTLATITFQNYFRLYGKLSGMTGTALTEEERNSATPISWTLSKSRPTSQ